MRKRARRTLTVASCVFLIAAFAITPSYLSWAETSSSAAISAPVPVVTSVKPSSVMWGEVISIAGRGFGKDLGTVKVGNREAQAISSWSDTEIRLQVPSGVDAGQASVVVKPPPKPAPAPKHTATGGPILIHNYLLPGPEGGFVPGVVTFRARQGADPFAIALRNGSEDPQPEVAGAEPGTKLSRYYRATVESGKEESTILKLATDPDVEWAEPIYIGSVGATPNDPRYTDGSQWGLNKVSAPLAWDYSKGSASVEVAIIDSGVKTDHEDLAPQFLSPARDYTGIGHVDDCGHGTHVAGIAAAATNNAKGVAGMGWDTKFRSYKVLRIDSQNDCSGFSNWFASAVNQAVNDGAEVINMSLSAFAVAPCPDLLVTAFDNAYNNGRLALVIAGNNSSESERFPSNCPNAFSVASSNPDDTLYTDPDDGSNFGNWVELTAPGVGILSSAIAGAPKCGAAAGQIYQYCTGTSMAAPFVSGAAALLYSLGASRATAAGLLKDASDPLTSGVCAQGKCGAGRLNAGDAVRALATRDHWVPTSWTYWFPWYDMTGGFSTDDIVVANKTSSPAKYRIWMGDSLIWGGKVPANQIAVATAPGYIGGPIRVVAPDGAPLSVSQRTIHQGSFAEVLAVRGDLAATDTYFPYYDDTGMMATWILVSNPSYTASASVSVFVGGMLRASPVISPNSTWAVRLGVFGGPVRITSSLPVVASHRAILLGTGFNEVMGSRLGLLSGEYWFPWYDMTGGFANDWVLVAHAVGSQSVTVSIYIAGAFMGSQGLSPGQVWAPQFPGVVAGPVKVVCSGCGSQGSAGPFVIASQRVYYHSSFSETPGTPTGAASGSTASEHWMPWYDSVSAGDDLLINNAGSSSASLSVIIGGQAMWSATLPAGSTTAAVSFVSLANGPVKVAGSAGSQLAVSQRVIWGMSFHETASGR